MQFSGINYGNPSTSTTLTRSKEESLDSRLAICMNTFCNAVTAKFLLRGLVNSAETGEVSKLSLPEKGTVGRDEIGKISKLQRN